MTDHPTTSKREAVVYPNGEPLRCRQGAAAPGGGPTPHPNSHARHVLPQPPCKTSWNDMTCSKRSESEVRAQARRLLWLATGCAPMRAAGCGRGAHAHPRTGALPAGFAVVKRGKDKSSGEPVAVKVRTRSRQPSSSGVWGRGRTRPHPGVGGGQLPAPAAATHRPRGPGVVAVACAG